MAARLTDMTAHGGLITGPGCATVLIGKMPAARVGDMHTCPMCTGPVPHVGGPIVMGCFTVLIGKMPAARQTDMAICVGPPSTILMGCPTVMIGSGGGGGGGGGGGSASDASSASPDAATAPQTVKGLTAEGIAITRVDAGLNQQVTAECLRLDLQIIGDSYNQDDQADEQLTGRIASAEWTPKRCFYNEDAELKIATQDMEDNTKLKVKLFEWDATNPDDFIEEIEVDSTGDETTLTWPAKFDVDSAYEEDEKEIFEIYPVIEVVDTNVAKVFRREVLNVDVFCDQGSM